MPNLFSRLFGRILATAPTPPEKVAVAPPAIITPPKIGVMPTPTQSYLDRNPVTLQLLQGIDRDVINNAQTRALIPFLNETLRDYGINTRNRIALFLAQVLHESGHLRYLREIWGPTPTQQRYEGRKDLGNTVAGDGSRFRGRGLIQTTGRNNYTLLSKEMGVDFIRHPEWLELPKYAAYSAGAFWKRNNLNLFADLPPAKDGTTRADYSPFQLATIRINGGLNGYAERKHIYSAALKILPA